MYKKASGKFFDMNPEIRRRISRFLFMSKLSKQDKIDIYNNWKNYNISANHAAAACHAGMPGSCLNE